MAEGDILNHLDFATYWRVEGCAPRYFGKTNNVTSGIRRNWEIHLSKYLSFLFAHEKLQGYPGSTSRNLHRLPPPCLVLAP